LPSLETTLVAVCKKMLAIKVRHSDTSCRVKLVYISVK